MSAAPNDDSPNHRALLPIGLRDVLPSAAAREARVVEIVMSHFVAHGFERVKPPLIEFEENLLSGPGAATAGETFRMMDPASRRMMGLRSDMTIQVARIATTRLRNAPRPLRLCYAGQVLRVKGDALRANRQFTQAGLELIGSDAPSADAEALLRVAGSLESVGLKKVSIDLTLPTLVPTLCDALGVSDVSRRTVAAALDQKDIAAVKALGGDIAKTFEPLIACAGDADAVLARLDGMELPEAAAQCRVGLSRIAIAEEDQAARGDLLGRHGVAFHLGARHGFQTRLKRLEDLLRLARGQGFTPISCAGRSRTAVAATSAPPPAGRPTVSASEPGAPKGT